MFWLCNNLVFEKFIILFKIFLKMDYYQFISCDFYDELEVCVMFWCFCYIEFWNVFGQV